MLRSPLRFPTFRRTKFMNGIGASKQRKTGSGNAGSRTWRRLKPSVIALEGRALLSTFTVDSTADDGSSGTLRWAVGQANANKGADTIVFSSPVRHAADDHPDRRPAHADRPIERGDDDDHRPGSQTADGQRGWPESGV